MFCKVKCLVKIFLLKNIQMKKNSLELMYSFILSIFQKICLKLNSEKLDKFCFDMQ